MRFTQSRVGSNNSNATSKNVTQSYLFLTESRFSLLLLYFRDNEGEIELVFYEQIKLADFKNKPRVNIITLGTNVLNSSVGTVGV